MDVNTESLNSLSLENGQPSSSPADLLPPELWDLIFQHLSAAELLPVRLTCHRWKAIVTGSPRLLQKISVTLAGIFVDLSRYVIPAGKIYIRMCRINDPLDGWWAAIGHRIVYLTLDDCDLKLSTLAEMLAHTPNLRRLRLDGTFLSMDCEVEASFRLEKLEKLVIEWVNCDSIFDIFKDRCPRLKIFKIYGTQEDDRIAQFLETVEDTLEYIAMTPSAGLLKEISNITRLKLKQIQFGGNNFSQDQFIEFCRMNPTIENVTIRYFGLSVQTLHQIGLHLPTLNRLQVTIDQEGTVQPTFLQSMKQLKYLFLSGDGDRRVDLDLTGCECPTLIQLQTHDLPPLQHGLRQFFEKSNKIWYLSIEGSSFDSWYEVFNSLEPLENLHDLVLRQLNISESYDDDVEEDNDQPGKEYCSLKSLELSYCKLSKQMLVQKVSQCTELEELKLTAIDSVDEAAVLTLISNLTKLRVLEISPSLDSILTKEVLERCKARGISIN